MNEKEITKWLIDNVFRNEKYYTLHDEDTLNDMLWDLMVIVASLHNEYYKLATGEYYDYMFHWVNKMNCGSIDDDIFKLTNNKQVIRKKVKMNNLIIELIKSDDYKKRMLGEYLELKERYTKLHNLLIKYEAGTLNFELTCPFGLLERQANLMGNYLKVLEIRMEMEGVSTDYCKEGE